MKIPFDIKYRPQIESGEYGLVTRTGWPVRIICWDYKTAKKKGYKLIGLIESKAAGHKPDEFISFYYNSGKCERDKESAHDLFIITPEPELTEFEQMLYSIFDAYNGLKIDIRAAVETNAKTLLELAKKEICKGCTVGLEQYWKGYEEAMKSKKHYTFQCPTYEPPCFHGEICTNPMRDCINCPMHSSGATTNTTSETCKKD